MSGAMPEAHWVHVAKANLATFCHSRPERVGEWEEPYPWQLTTTFPMQCYCSSSLEWSSQAIGKRLSNPKPERVQSSYSDYDSRLTVFPSGRPRPNHDSTGSVLVLLP